MEFRADDSSLELAAFGECCSPNLKSQIESTFWNRNENNDDFDADGTSRGARRTLIQNYTFR